MDTEPIIGLLLNKVSVEVITVPKNDSFYTSFILDSSMGMLEICLHELQLVPFINAIEIYPQDRRAYMLKDPSQNVILSMHLRVNVGGDELSETADGFRKWDSDVGIWPNSEILTTANVINIDVPWNFYHLPPALFQNARYPTDGSVLNYTTDELNQVDGRNKWLVVLYFVELDPMMQKDTRVFDIKVNDIVAYPAFDILEVAGSAFTAYVIQVETTLQPGGILDVQLVGSEGKQPPLLSGLEAFEMITEQPDPELNERSAFRIDCGGPVSFKNDLGLFWRQDQGYTSGYVSTIPKPSINNYMNNTLRYFPDGGKNCYVNKLPGTGRYIVRLNILYQDYDGYATPPKFSVSVQRALVFTNYTVPAVDRKPRGRFDVLVNIPSGEAEVCFYPDDDVNMTDPFINGLEYLPIETGAYAELNDPTYMLVNVARINCGGPTFGDGFDNVTLGDGSIPAADGSFPDYRKDRAWRVWHDEREWLSPDVLAALETLNATSATNIRNQYTGSPNFWPDLIYQTARILPGADPEQTLEYTINLVDWVQGDQVAYYLHFAELNYNVNVRERVFDIIVDGKTVKSNFDVLQTAANQLYQAIYVYGVAEPSDKTLTITFKSSVNMPGNKHGPLINAIEVYKVLTVGKATDPKDVLALESLKKPMNIGDELGWQGDPCDPENWEGLTCSDPSDTNPWKIITIDLNRYDLNGTLPTGFAELDQLDKLDLSNNRFSGPIPQELGFLPRLKSLDLSNNSLSGKIPDAVLALASRNDFTLNLQGNPQLCGGAGYFPCRQPSKKFNGGAIAGAVVGLVLLIAVVTAVVCVLMKKRHAHAFQRMDSSLNDSDVIKGPETVGAAMDRIRKPRNLKLPPRGPALSRSDSLSSTGSSNNSRMSSRYEGFDVELGDVPRNGSQENGSLQNGTQRQGSRLRPPVDDVVQVGFDGK
eukprot:TRINITY_DN1391_c0_g2_i2.p1 TRINITY_DN1391_c0_g2~~TRINITY_DN1391_c0_g2_i2.p1  ORF type:complete len:983 (-),score=175.44 TRINITY_DN1391_c0_g2_i2:986-3778(-)